MRGLDEPTGALFSYVDLEARVRSDHPLRSLILEIANDAAFTLALAAYNLIRLPTLVEAPADHAGDEADFTARPWVTSSAAC